MENSEYHMGFLLGVVFGVIIFIIAYMIKKQKVGKCEFDERQIQARGKAFKYGFFSLLLYMIIYGIMQDVTEVYWGKGLIGSSLGICIGVTVFAVVSIWNDAYFSLQENPKRFAVLFAAVLIFNLGLGIPKVIHPEELMNYGYINLFIGIMALIIIAALGLKALKSRREAEENEE